MRFEKLMFKNTVKRLAKSQFDLKNCRLVFKILYLKKKKKKKKNRFWLVLKKNFFCFWNRNFLKTQFLNSSFFATWFKITILTAPLMKRKKK